MNHSTQLVIKSFRPCANITSVTFFEKLSKLEELISKVLSYKRERLCWSINSLQHKLCIPKFYIAGFPKCGTTSLYKILLEHRQIVHPAVKETQFWRHFLLIESKEQKERLLWHYLCDIVDPRHSAFHDNNILTFDSSASTIFDLPYIQHYFHHEYCLVPFLHKKLNPDSKYIVIMRNPIEQTWSAYWYFCYRTPPGKRPEAARMALMFHDSVMSALNDFKKCLANSGSDFLCAMESKNGAFPHLHLDSCHHIRLGISHYYFHIVRWLSVFPREHFLFLRMEDLAAEPRNVLRKVSEFLNITSFPPTPQILKVTNSRANQYHPREGFQMMQETRDLLTAFFRPYNKKLVLLLDDPNFLWNGT